MALNKLVRDKIPQMIEKAGGKPNYRILAQEEYITCLEAKLDEEVAEFHSDKKAEELADILEVVFALAKAYGCEKEELMDVYSAKHEARGGFAQRIFLMENDG